MGSGCACSSLCSYFLRAMRADKNDPYVTVLYGNFLASLERFEDAEHFYLVALELDPNNAHSLEQYGSFLVLTDRASEADDVFDRAKRCAVQQTGGEHAITSPPAEGSLESTSVSHPSVPSKDMKPKLRPHPRVTK
jgi:hypothetical protein